MCMHTSADRFGIEANNIYVLRSFVSCLHNFQLPCGNAVEVEEVQAHAWAAPPRARQTNCMQSDVDAHEHVRLGCHIISTDWPLCWCGQLPHCCRAQLVLLPSHDMHATLAVPHGGADNATRLRIQHAAAQQLTHLILLAATIAAFVHVQMQDCCQNAPLHHAWLVYSFVDSLLKLS